ncbi:hypothetical protein ACSSS7_002937 [Eimeria intestinalis]
MVGEDVPCSFTLFCPKGRDVAIQSEGLVELANSEYTKWGFKRNDDMKLRSWGREDACTKPRRPTYFTSFPLSTLWILVAFYISYVLHTAAASARGNPHLAWADSGENRGHMTINYDMYISAPSHLALAHSTPTSVQPLNVQAVAAPRHLEAAEDETQEEGAFFDIPSDLILPLPQQSTDLLLQEISPIEEREVHPGEADIEEEEEDEALVSDRRERAADSIQQCALDGEGNCVPENTCILIGGNEADASALSINDSSDDSEDSAAFAAKHAEQQDVYRPHRRMQQLDVSSLGPAAQYAQYLNTFMPAGQQRQQLQLLQQAIASGGLGAANIAALKRLQRRAQAAAYANSVSSHPLVQGVVRTTLTAVADILGSISVADVVHGAVGGALLTPVAPLI